MPDDRAGDPFAGDGEMRALCRATNWAATPLGPVESWSGVLRSTVRTCLESPFPINLWCEPELVLIYNDAYRHVLGAKHPAALGKPGSVVWAEIWEHIAPMFAQIRAGGPAVYAADAPFVVRRVGEEDTRTPGGPNAWFTFSLSAVRDDDGEIVAFLNIVSESTPRMLAEQAREVALARVERAEARLREVFAKAPSFLAMLRGPRHVFEYANEAYYQLVGHRDLLGRSVFEAMPELRGQGFEELLDEVFTTGRPFIGREAPVLLSRTPGAAAEERFVDFVFYPVTEADGTRSGVVVHGSDVTDHVLARREAQRARAEAEQANRAKSDFLATMSHEIRTPINAIIGYTDLLEMGLAGPVTERQREQLERVRASGRHLRALVEDILDLSKAEAGRIEVAHERAPVASAIQMAIALVGPQASRCGVALEDRCAADRGMTYVGDEDRVRQILVNLLSNAVKFTPPGGAVRITCGTTDRPDPEAGIQAAGAFTFIRVADTGIGIDPEQLEAIFHPFVQAETGHTRTRGGTGLGLTISRQLARLMGGDLTARSAPGEGSTFTLWLPGQAAGAAPPASTMLEETRPERPRSLSMVGEAVRDSIDGILDAFTARLRLDPLVPRAASLRQGNVENHASSLLADIAQSLIALEESDADMADLLRDGSEIQQLISRLHGIQRARLGWTEEALRREFEILREETEGAALREAGSAADIETALGVLTRFLRHAERVSVRGWRQAAGAVR